MSSMLATNTVHYLQRAVNENGVFLCLIWDVIIWKAYSQSALPSSLVFLRKVTHVCFRPTDDQTALSFQLEQHLSLQIICFINENQKQLGVFCA